MYSDPLGIFRSIPVDGSLDSCEVPRLGLIESDRVNHGEGFVVKPWTGCVCRRCSKIEKYRYLNPMIQDPLTGDLKVLPKSSLHG